MRNCEELLDAYIGGTLDLAMVSEEELILIKSRIYENADSINTLISCQ